MCSSPHWQVGSSWFREKLSPANRNKGYRGEQISRKIVSCKLNARSYRDFAKNIALLSATSAKFAKSVGKKMGSNMRPRYIQFRDIHDRDISDLHCTMKFCKCHDSVTAWHVQNLVVISWAYFKLEHSTLWSNFKFDRNTVSGMGTFCYYLGTSSSEFQSLRPVGNICRWNPQMSCREFIWSW